MIQLDICTHGEDVKTCAVCANSTITGYITAVGIVLFFVTRWTEVLSLFGGICLGRAVLNYRRADVKVDLLKAEGWLQESLLNLLCGVLFAVIFLMAILS